MPPDSSPAPTDPFSFLGCEDIESAEVPIEPPGGGAPLMFVTLAGPTHRVRRDVVVARTRRIREATAKAGRLALGDPAQDEDDETDLLVSCTLSWRGSDSLPAFSPAAVRALYTNRRYRWVREAVKEALDDRARFTTRSAPL